MSALNDGEEDHPVGGRPPKGASRDGEEFISNSQQMKEALDKGLTRKDDTVFSAPSINLPQEDFYDSSQKDQEYVQPSVSARAYSKPFSADYAQPSCSRDFQYSQPPPYSREFQGSGSQFSYGHPSSRAFSSRPGGADLLDPPNILHGTQISGNLRCQT